jgi:hypothetical protein
MSRVWSRLRGHFQEYVSRYAVLVLAVLVPASTLLGKLAADIGVDTRVGQYIAMGSAALATGAAGVTFIKNMGIWQMLDTFGTAPGTAAATRELVPLPPLPPVYEGPVPEDESDEALALSDGEAVDPKAAPDPDASEA